MTEPMYYGSSASLQDLLESDAISEQAKANIRDELRHRAAACIAVDPAALKMLRETLALSQSALASCYKEDFARRHIARLDQVIAAIDRHRPLGPDGTHDNRHTPTCGCEDKT